MREILFRGRDTDGVWCKGFYCVFNGKSHRIYTGYAETDCGDYYPDYFNVDTDTVGQYTGLTDKNGTKIFEGDIGILCEDSVPCIFGYDDGCFRVCHNGFAYIISFFESSQIEVIGNIYDNPELLRSDTE